MRAATLLLVVLFTAACGDDGPDPLGEIRRLQADGSPEAAARLDEIYRSGNPDTHAAAARAIVTLGEAALARGERRLAAQRGLNVYLSSAPADARLRALRLYARGAGAEALPRLEHIVEGLLDRDFLRHLPELLREIPGEEARALEVRLRGLWEAR